MLNFRSKKTFLGVNENKYLQQQQSKNPQTPIQ